MTTATAAEPRASSSATAIRIAILITSGLIAACDGGGGRDDPPPPDPDRRAHQLAREMQIQAGRCEPAADRRDPAACERACDLGHSNSCAQLGVLAQAAGQRDAALAHFSRACRGGSGVGCEGAARLGADEALYRQARGYHRVHCEQGYARSCAALGELHASERGGPASAATAGYYRRRACHLGWKAACPTD